MQHQTTFILFTLLSLTLAQIDYQERAIFLSEDDNPCKYGSGSLDRVNYIIYVPGKETIKQTVFSTTTCEQECLVPSQAIDPSDGMTLTD